MSFVVLVECVGVGLEIIRSLLKPPFAKSFWKAN
jgi:hypothetical protein